MEFPPSPGCYGVLTKYQARGKEALRGPAYHQRLLPAHTQLKFRYALVALDVRSQSSLLKH